MDRIISKEKEREDIQGEILQGPSIPHVIQQLQVILHTELILPQETPKKLQLQGSSHADS